MTDIKGVAAVTVAVVGSVVSSSGTGFKSSLSDDEVGEVGTVCTASLKNF